MSSMKFTEEQQAVIDARGCNLLVSAAAGSGKTAVLVERIIQLITGDGTSGGKPVDIDHLLVVTFTRAAAAQMKERITQAIEDRLIADPGNAHLQKQETLIHNAQITTIDSFCQYVIRNNWGDIGLDPSYRVADEGEIKLLEQNVMTDFLEKKYAEGDDDFLYTSDYFSTGSGDTGLEEQIKRLYRFSMSMPWPEDWLRKSSCDYDLTEDNFDSVSWIRDYVRDAADTLREISDSYREALTICNQPDGPYFYGDLLEQELEMIERAAMADDYDAIRSAASLISFGRLPSKKDDSVSPGKRDMVKNIRDAVKKQVAKLQKSYFALDRETLIETSKAPARALHCLCSLAIEFKNALDAEKREQNIIDFTDMEHFALQILVHHDPETGECSPTASAEEYRAFFQEILIDEYQDSNSVQELILSAIGGQVSGAYDRFMVGDVKQSIYKFRLARPEIFMDKLDRYDKDASAPKRRIDLHRNFRSRYQVLDGVNYIFRRIMGHDLGGVRYDEDAMLQAGASYPEPVLEDGNKVSSDSEDKPCDDRGLTQQYSGKDPYATELILIQNDDAGSGDDGFDENSGQDDGVGDAQDIWGLDEDPIEPGAKLNPRQQEAMVIAGRIRELLKSGQVSDGNGGFRRVRLSDIVILLRATSGWDDTFRKILDSEGIPTYVESRTGYFGATEVATLLDLLRVLDNPLQDIPLAGVMHSCLGGFSNEELAEIKANATGGSHFYDLLLLMEKDDHNSLGEKTHLFLEWIRDLRRRAVYMPVHELLDYILVTTGYRDYVTAEPSGARRRANVDMLLQRAESFEKTSFKGLFHFVRYIEELQRYEVDFGEANVLDENADVVRIMSIHKSKGLEFPIVFLAGMSKRFNRQDALAPVLLDEDLGIGINAVDLGLRIKMTTPRRSMIADKMVRDSLGEELRVLYVAMTRAKEKLIMTGSVTKPEKKIEDNLRLAMSKGPESQPELLPLSARRNASDYMILVLRALMGHPAMKEAADQLGVDVSLIDYSRAVRDSFDRRSLGKGQLPAMEELLRVLPPFEIRVVPSSSISSRIMAERVDAGARRNKLEQGITPADVDTELRNSLLENFSYSYPHKNYENLYTKTTVSELKRAAYTEENEAAYTAIAVHDDSEYVPSFIEAHDDTLKGAGRGTAYHRVMELLDESIFGTAASGVSVDDGGSETASVSKVREWIRTGEAAGLMFEGTYQSVYAKDIVTFLKSDLGKRMAEAFRQGNLYRERQFMMGIPDTDLSPDLPEGEIVLIQGVIDAYFEEDGGIVLVDYKTDHIDSAEQLISRYRLQLDYYQQAIERLTHKKVRERYLYSFALGEAIRV